MILLPVYLFWWLFVEFFPMQYAAKTAVRWYYNSERLTAEGLPKAVNLFLGESRLNAGLDFCALPSSYSFASGGSTPIEMYYVLEKYLQAGGRPKRVFVSVSPRFFMEKFVFWPYAVRSGFFSFSDLREIAEVARENPDDSLFSVLPELKYGLYVLNYPGFYQQDVARMYHLRRKSENRKFWEYMQSHCGARPHPGLKSECSGLNRETDFSTFKASPILDVYFRRILELCKTERIELIFFSLPVNESSFQSLTPDFKRAYKLYFKDLQRVYPNFVLQNSIYAYPDSLFGDPSHLNEEGKKTFTHFLKKNYFP